MAKSRKGKPGKAGSGAVGDRRTPAASHPAFGSAFDPDRHGFWWALAVLVLLLVVFFNPLFFGGKTFLAPDQAASIAQQTFVKESFASHGSWLQRYPLWTPYIFSGMPSFGSLIAGPYTSPTGEIIKVLPRDNRMVLAYVLLGLMVWILLRRRGLGTVPALFGACAYIFTTYVIVFMMFGHNTKVLTLIYLPVLILTAAELWKRPTVRWTLVLALAVANMLLARHVQIAYYAFLALGLFLVVYTVGALRDKLRVGSILARWGATATGIVLGFAGSAVLLIPVQEYAAYSIRGSAEGGGASYAFATGWSFHPAEMATFFVPSFMGFGGNTYWGRMPFTDSPHYMGILVLFLAVLAVVRWPRERFHVYLILLSVFALLVSFGSNFPLVFDVLYKWFPFFNKFRVPVMILVLLQFSVAILAATAVHRIAAAAEDERKRTARAVWTVGAVMGGVVLLLGGAVMGGGLDGAITHRLSERFSGAGLSPAQMNTVIARQLPAIKSMVQTDTVVGLMVLVLGLAVIWLFLRGRMPAWIMGACLLVLAVADLWNVDHRPATYYPRTDRASSFVADSAVRFLDQDTGPYRILPLTPPSGNQNWFAYHGISSILGYHPAKLKLYQKVIDERGPVGIRHLLSQGNFNLLNILNTKYVLADREIPVGPLVTVHRGDEVVMQNKACLPRMWFPKRARVVPDEDSQLGAIADPNWNPRDEVLCFADPGPVDTTGSGTAVITRYEPREIRATVTTPGPSLLVVSEVYYPAGWHATVDGEPAEIQRVNYFLRGVHVPAGSHELVMRFDPASFRAGLFLSAGAYAVILLGLLASVLASRRRRPPAPEPPQ